MAQTGSSTGARASANLIGLKRARSLLRQATSDLSLTNEEFSDANSVLADYYINKAQEYLDAELKDIRLLARRIDYALAVGVSEIYIGDQQTVYDVHVRNPEIIGSETEVVPAILEALRATYPGPFDEVDAGLPLWWGFTGDRNPEDLAQKQIAFLPPADIAYTVSIFAAFSSAELVVASDTSIWTEKYPNLLVGAAKMFWADEVGEEKMYQRSSRAVDRWLDRIQSDQSDSDSTGQLWRKQE